MTEESVVEEVVYQLEKIYDVLNTYSGESGIIDDLHNHIEDVRQEAVRWLRGRS